MPHNNLLSIENVRVFRLLVFVFGLSFSAFGCTAGTRTNGGPEDAAQQHLKKVMATLPFDSPLRSSLEIRPVSNQSNSQLTEQMQKEGIRVAYFEIQGIRNSRGEFHPVTALRVIYRRKYDGPNSQITDANHLARFREIGLEKQLELAAFERSKHVSGPMGSDLPTTTDEECMYSVYLLDDESLADLTGFYLQPDFSTCGPTGSIFHAAGIADELTIRKLLSTQRFTQSDLDAALVSAVYYPPDNTDVISLLIQAGANVNAHGGPDDRTVLMEAVEFRNFENIKALLDAGADVNRKSRSGMTAYSRAAGSTNFHPLYMPELLKLLKPTR